MRPSRTLPTLDIFDPPSPALLEMPSVLSLPTQDSEKRDILGAPGGFFLSPFYAPADASPLPPVAEQTQDDIDPGIERSLKALRKSPGFRLIAESDLLLRACQMDMDIPLSRRQYIRDRLIRLLTERTGKPLDPDNLRIRFITLDCPSTDDDGREHYHLALSLTETALATFDTSRFIGLYRSAIVDTPVSADPVSGDKVAPDARALFQAIAEAPWADDFTAEVDAFWKRHRKTYRALCKLSFLDGLARQLARKTISQANYLLTLDALGLGAFPENAAAVEHTGRGKKTEVRALSLDGELIPGLFQVRSKNTSHCFVHVPGGKVAGMEYISDNPLDMTRKLLAALNDSEPHRRLLHMLEQAGQNGAVVESVAIEGDVFDAMVQAFENVTRNLLDGEDYDRFDWRKPLARGLTLASAVDVWQARPPILQSLPRPSKAATQIMADYLKTRHGLTLDPNQVFIAYRRGHATTPLGDLRRPTTHVHVPDERPVSLTQALMTNYRIQYPAGYIDHGGRTLVYRDTTGKGVWSHEQTLPVEAQEIEDCIKSQDFLTLMSARIDAFWEEHKLGIEQAFRSILIGQALIGVKQGRLSRAGFDRVVEALIHPDSVRWLSLGFHVKDSLLGPMPLQHAGLLVLDGPGQLHVLYQVGHAKAFMEFADRQALDRHLRLAAADIHWQQAVMRLVPLRHQDRLTYLLRVWAGVQTPQAPASILRPWTDALYNPDIHQAMHHGLSHTRLTEPLFGFMRRLLKQNSLHDAEDRIVTSAEVSLRYWTSRLHQLQWLLAPMSVLLTPALIASLAVEIGIASLNIAAARLPGKRDAEKNQALLSLLTLGLMQLGPQTPGLLRSLKRVMTPASRAPRTGHAVLDRARGFNSLARRSMSPRQTRLEKFFHTEVMLKRWTIPGHPRFGALAVHAWKLGRRFVLWTSDRGQARTLVVSTHGHYMPWSTTVRIPHGTEIRTYAPHGYELVDPKLHRVVAQKVQAFATSNTLGNNLVQPPPALPALVVTDRLIAGTSLPGRLKNYTLTKFQTLQDESYDDIAHIVRNANASPLSGQLPPVPMDVLTVRNRFGMTPPTLGNLFDTLAVNGIHYDRILLVHCRCAAIDSLLRRAPVYRAPTTGPTIVKMP